MKKFNLAVLLFVTMFFIAPSNVNGFPGGYAYDVNELLIETAGNRKYIVIDGWAAIDDNVGNLMNNINPKYTLKLIGMDASGKKEVVTSAIYSNVAPVGGGFTEPGSTPRDYTKAWYSKMRLVANDKKSPSPSYPNEANSNRGRYVCLTYSRGNRFYINIDFKFRIPLEDIRIILRNNNVDGVYFRLTVETVKGEHTVFGFPRGENKQTEEPKCKRTSKFPTSKAKREINLAIKENMVSAAVKKELEELSFMNTVSKIVTITEDGYVQRGEDIFMSGNKLYYLNRDPQHGKIVQKGGGTVYNKNDGHQLNDKDTSWHLRSLYYLGNSKSLKSPYNVIGSRLLKDFKPTPDNVIKYRYYTVKVSVDPVASGYNKNMKHYYYIPGKIRVKDDPKNGVVSYIPAFWVANPQGIATYITSSRCERLACKNLQTDCPEECCSEYCSDSQNKDSAFCSKICNKKEEENCEKYTDPQRKYCCLYPKDEDVCAPYSGQYPKKDPVNKPSTCQSGGPASVTFKYPEKGWGHSVLKNDACLISCQEELTATFQPSQYVKAGMGFTYPVNMNSSRYCTAEYDNLGWKKKVDAAAKAANTAYKDMVIALEKAEDLDNKCGGKERLEKNPTCSTECPDRNGGICSGSKCGTCTDYDKPIYCKKPSNKICGYETYPCYGTTSVTCPSGYTYSGSIDKCVKYVCSKDNSKLWSSAQKEIGDKITSASSALSQYDTNVKRINDLNGERNTCDNYVSLNQYKGAFSTSISTSNVPNQSGYVSTSASFNEDVSFESDRQSKETKYAIFQCYDRPYYESVTLVGDYKSQAKTFTGIYCEYKTADQKYRDFWNKKSDADINLEFSTLYYVQRYTGELSTASSSGYDRHGRYAYTGFYDYSGSNGFSLAVTNIGPNLAKVSNSLWSINPFTCEYTVENLIFPPNGDDNYDKYGSVAFMFRQISLNDPFPGRQPHRNWSGKEKLITSNGYGVYAQQPLYAIGLNPRVMRDVRKEKVGYASFNIHNPYKSDLLRELINNRVIIKRK